VTFEEMKKLPPDKQKEIYLKVKSIRTPYKATNYSAVYGVGPPKLARELTISLAKAKKLLSDYWDRNWAVKEVVKEQYVKTLKDGSMWLYNPVSGFYYSLRFEKDIFSTLNQSTGVYCFDTWVAFCRAAGVKIPMQYHDEILVLTEDEQIELTKEKLYSAIEKTNSKIKLNVPLAIDVQVGKNYAEVH
jgi:DNA polymerase I-like protein with 3'-5' exonuclease and polymerase domains